MEEARDSKGLFDGETMSAEITMIYQNKTYIFLWGTGHCTFTQLIDGSRAAWCVEEDTYYWFYFEPEDGELTEPLAVIEMSEDELDELDYLDILKDLSDANNRGMYPEVTQEVRKILIGRNARREVIFALNKLDVDLIKTHKGIVYLASRQVINLLEEQMELRTAVGIAINTCIKTYSDNLYKDRND